MPITIWRPRGYVEGFEYSGTLPVNGSALAAPYSRDTKVCEVTRFEGWASECFCDVGEFEVTTDKVLPEHVKHGYMVEVDGRHYVVENIRWERDDGTYRCTFGGRDFWKFAECQISHRWVGDSYDIAGGSFTGETLAQAIANWFTAQAAGWWRDRLRLPRAGSGTTAQNWEDVVRFDLHSTTQSEVLAKTINASVSNIMSYGAEWRMFCNWYSLGLRFSFAFNENSGVYEIDPVLYDGQDNGIVIATDSRGVTGFEYEHNTQGTVNAAYMLFESGYKYTQANASDYVPDDYSGTLAAVSGDPVRSRLNVIADSAASFSERAQFLSEAYVDAGTPSEEQAASVAKVRAWMNQSADDSMVSDEVSFKFKYDNTGAMRYGEHFMLGDWLTIADGFLGIEAKQRLTEVKTKYDAGKAKEYEFEFTSQRITQSDVLKRKFAEINRRTYGSGRKA